MIIREEIRVSAPPERVWSILTDLDRWADWNPVCRECRLEKGPALDTGARLSFQLTPLFFPLRIAPRITRCDAGQTLVWAGAKWGLRAEHTFLFETAPEGTRLESIEHFSGWMLPALQLLGIPRRLHRLTKELLVAVKKAAERPTEPINTLEKSRNPR